MTVRLRNKRTGTTGTFSHPDVLSDEWVPIEPEAEPVAKTKPVAEPVAKAKTGKTPTKKH